MKRMGIVSTWAIALVGAGLMTAAVNAAQPACGETMTGGGWIITDAGTGNFGFSGGESLSRPFSLNYVDEEAGVHVKAIAIVDYSGADGSDGPCRTITYEVTLNGEPGYCASIRVCENGEPATLDSFEIAVFGPNVPCPCVEDTATTELECPIVYADAGVLGDGGGNIQLHERDCD